MDEITQGSIILPGWSTIKREINYAINYYASVESRGILFLPISVSSFLKVIEIDEGISIV